MAEIKTITSTQNSAFKQAAKYAKSQEARKDNVFLVEGVRAVSEVLKAGDWNCQNIWISESLWKSGKEFGKELMDKAQCPVYQVSDAMMQRLSDTMTPQGVVAVVARRNYKVADVLKDCHEKGERPLLVILENLQDPGNVGTVIRTCDAAAASALIVTRGTTDIYAPKVIRAAMGSLLHLPVCRVESAAELAQALKKANIQVLAAALKEDSVTPYEIDMKKPTAILIGNEGNGLTEEAVEAADMTVKIPMPGKAESLNAGVAAGVMVYEAVRQRMN